MAPIYGQNRANSPLLCRTQSLLRKQGDPALSHLPAEPVVRNWCTENYFGKWLTLPAYEPSIKPFTKEELQRIEDVAAMLETKLRIRYSEEAVTLNAHDGYSVYATPKL